MIAIVKALLAMIRSLFKSRSALHVEILVLRHQLNVLGRGSCHRAHLTNSDRLFFVWLYRMWPGLLRAVAILRPETIVRCTGEAFARTGDGGLAADPGGQRSPMNCAI